MLKGMFGLCGNGFSSFEINTLLKNNLVFLLVACLACTPAMKNLGKLVSLKQQSELKRNVFVEGRVKTQNKVVTTVIDTIHHAIASNKKISFSYSLLLFI